MRFLLDESADARLIPYLRASAHNATRIASEHPAGLPDHEVLALAVQEDRILIAADRDFGELIVRLQLPHRGVILFRLGDFAEIDLWIARLAYVLEHHERDLESVARGYARGGASSSLGRLAPLGQVARDVLR